MINGVTILASETVMTSCAAMSIILAITIGLGILGFLLFIGGLVSDCMGIGVTGAIMVVSSFLLCLIGAPIDNATLVPDYKTYEVTIDDSVSMNEFTSKYEILEQRGKIYVVKEIEE